MSLDTAQTNAGGPPPPSPTQTPPAPAATARVKARRRPWVFALMAALVAAGALGTAFAFTSVNDTQEVLVVANDIKRGETIEAGDLTVVRVSVDPALTPVPGSQKAELEGSRAAVDLWAGTLLTEQAVTDSLVPGEGESLVGISLTPAQMPSEPLYGGDAVRIVTTPGDQGEVTDEEPVTIEAVVVGVSRVEETGETVVDVSVPEREAADLAARAATGRVALVLDARER
ncbi:SAF domain-containing protein [Pimelobacter simplex]|uniref:SAF domain-containing protein n=1 Tax=Nocardioides simplex TaxID=2045 RepID=UPI0021503559|nr:SAF domain-containing protein [Pimelobacter simplex]UUW92919.1 SAF domain-containing protein [Pimelobacter simplex]UUW98952.1 SAF domain-containing protein [Pimelobacter simplex]